MKLKHWEAALMAGFAIFLLAGSVLQTQANALSGEFLRLHVLAHSDSEEDQNLKLIVRDEVLRYSQTLLNESMSRSEMESVLYENLDVLTDVAAQTIAAEGYDYPVTLSLTDAHFPTKEYADFALPAGTYRALRVVIGSGGGQNWWCVLFPPLCLGAVTEEVSAQEAMNYGLSEENIALITGEDEGYILKFKCLELWDDFVSSFA